MTRKIGLCIRNITIEGPVWLNLKRVAWPKPKSKMKKVETRALFLKMFLLGDVLSSSYYVVCRLVRVSASLADVLFPKKKT
jgi:hypothetical protein